MSKPATCAAKASETLAANTHQRLWSDYFFTGKASGPVTVDKAGEYHFVIEAQDVGLTQDVTNDELKKDAAGNIINPNAKQYANCLVYLDRSVVKDLFFSSGKFKAAGSTRDFPWDEVWSKRSIRPGDTLVSDALKPSDKADGIYIIDFAENNKTDPHPLTKNRPSDGTPYQTNFNAENVIVTLGAPSRSLKVEAPPKPE